MNNYIAMRTNSFISFEKVLILLLVICLSLGGCSETGKKEKEYIIGKCTFEVNPDWIREDDENIVSYTEDSGDNQIDIRYFNDGNTIHEKVRITETHYKYRGATILNSESITIDNSEAYVIEYDDPGVSTGKLIYIQKGNDIYSCSVVEYKGDSNSITIEAFDRLIDSMKIDI